jgi:hypothetical protein
MPKLSHAKIVTKTFSRRPDGVAWSGEAHGMPGKLTDLHAGLVLGMKGPFRKLPVTMLNANATAKHDIDVPAPQVHDAGSDGSPPLESGVFLSPDLAPNSDVTLIVYAWHNVQPGTLSWTFPTVRAAVSAAYAMRNAVKWAIVRGIEENIDLARLAGRVMIENC